MTRFTDGPAKGKTLMLKRCLQFLRVTERNGLFDALDMPEDSPRPDEKIYAYVLEKHMGNCHVNRGSAGGGFYPLADFKFVTNQPADAVMRDSKSWGEWCEAQPAPF